MVQAVRCVRGGIEVRYVYAGAVIEIAAEGGVIGHEDNFGDVAASVCVLAVGTAIEACIRERAAVGLY